MVTSGTGSGKSLTYFVPIFDAVLKGNRKIPRVWAIIVYRAILFWEATEGGLGVLRRLAEEPDAIAQVARTALDLLHFDSETGDDLRPSDSETGCARACYECLLSYYNQRDHASLDRHAVGDFLMLLARSVTRVGDAVRSYDAHYRLPPSGHRKPEHRRACRYNRQLCPGCADSNYAGGLRVESENKLKAIHDLSDRNARLCGDGSRQRVQSGRRYIVYDAEMRALFASQPQGSAIRLTPCA